MLDERIIQSNPDGRYVVRITSREFVEPCFDCIDRATGLVHYGRLAPELVERLYADIVDACGDICLVETHDDGAYCPRFGEWKIGLPPRYAWLKNHPFLRWLIQDVPYFVLVLNEAGIQEHNHRLSLDAACSAP